MEGSRRKIAVHVEHIKTVCNNCTTEKSTKQALILRLLNLDFSPFATLKVTAESGASFAASKAMAGNVFRIILVCIFLLGPYADVWAATDAKNLKKSSIVGSKNPYSLTISGGISLGVYEAGLNAVIVDALRDGYIKSGGDEFRLEAITGASAGAINALISAIRFCEQDDPGKTKRPYVYNNLFKETWQNVDVEDLLSENSSDYDQLRLDLGTEKKQALKDSIFSRKTFVDLINQLRQRVNDGQFRENMQVKLAFMVTRSKPLGTMIKTTPESQKIGSQRFVIPLIAKTQRITKNGVSKVGLLFKNYTSYKPCDGRDMEHLFLPESDGYVEFDQVARAALASSAFPFAFSRVELAYCQRLNDSDSSGHTLSNSCPKGYKPARAYFIDGGTFDNVPLGVAVELIEHTGRVPATYIYMDPANRRSVSEQSDDAAEDQGALVLAEQVKAWVPAFGTLMNGELYRTLITHFSGQSNADRALLLTRRFPPLTGNFLGHFGAFLDPSFRVYDYSVGVYDGLMNATDYKCYLTKECRDVSASPDLVAVEKAKIFLDLSRKTFDFVNATKEDREMHQLIKAFLNWEKTSPAWNEAKEFFPETNEKSASYAVYEAITEVKESDFKGFLAQLTPNKTQFKHQLQYILDNPDAWWVSLGQRAIYRLIDIEEDGDGALLTPLKFSAVVANLKDVIDNKTKWSLSSVRKKKPWYLFVPDAIAMDGTQTGIAVSYLMAPPMLVGDWMYFEWELASLHFQIKEVDDDRINYWSFGGSLRHSLKNPAISSVGIGVYPNQNFGNTGGFGKHLLLGGEINIGLVADKLRISIGTRDLISDYKGEDWTVRFGFTDIDAWLSLF